MQRKNPTVSPTIQEEPMSTSDRHEDLGTVEQLAAHLNVKPSWVYAATAKGDIPVVKIGKYNRYRFSDVLKKLNRSAKP
jgi:excisionase family DNA binding protein